MDAKDIEAVTQLLTALDNSFLKGIGECLQVTARLAVRNLNSMPTPVATVSTPKSQQADDLTDPEDREFFLMQYRSPNEVADYIGESRYKVTQELLPMKRLRGIKDPENGYWKIETESVREYLLNGDASKAKVRLRSAN